MELVVNEVSLINAQLSIAELENFFKISLVIDKNMYDTLHFKSDFYDNKVTGFHNIYDFLVKSKSDVATAYKILMLKTIHHGPFWDLDFHQKDSIKYLFNGKILTMTGLAESTEYDYSVVSLFHNEFCSKEIIINIDGHDFIITNYTEIEQIKANHIASFSNEICHDSLSNLISETKCFIKHDDFDESYLSFQNRELEVFLKCFSKYVYTELKDFKRIRGVEYKKFKSDDFFGGRNDIHKFRVSRGYRCYGIEVDDTFQILKLEKNHKLSDEG